MKILYRTVDGRVVVENTKLEKKMIEMPDKYHPVTNDSVWFDAERRGSPILVLTQDVLAPYGGSMVDDDVEQLMWEARLAEKAFKPASVSKMWHRALARVIQWTFRWGIILLIFGLVAFQFFESQGMV